MVATEGITAVNAILGEPFDCVILDLKLGSDSGLDVLKKIKNINSNLPVILITGFGTINTAVQAIKDGAYDYIEKPVNFNKLLVTTQNAVEMHGLKTEVNKLSSMIRKNDIITQSPKVLQLIENAIILAKTDFPILLLGESGTGKELFAELIHLHSSNGGKSMQRINSASFAESLLDNELFGHEKDAYTGATSLFKGIFERSHESTLFLDEIGDMPLSIQAKILRAIQNKEIRRLGGSQTIHVETRFVAATNKDIFKMMNQGLFREDLYYRLNSGTLTIPPLRERTEDIPLLCRHFIMVHCENNSMEPKAINDDVHDYFLKYDWPGNVRELRSTILYALSISRTNRIDISDLPAYIVAGKKPFSSKETLHDAEKRHIENTLLTTNFNKTKAAQLLNISRRTLYNKMELYGIS
jgi:DNA-binding NtrC family response regulator